MTLAAGSRLGIHEILGLLGVRGMGEVYRRNEPGPTTNRRNVDSLPGGEHIVGVTNAGPGEGAGRQITVVLNWFDEVRATVPVN